MTAERSTDRRTYDEATRTFFGLISSRDSTLADYAINNQAHNVSLLKSFGASFLTPKNMEFLLSVINDLGRAQYISNLDPLSQASIYLRQQERPDARQSTKKTPLTDLDIPDTG